MPAIVGCCALGAVAYPFVIPWLIGDASFAAGAVPFAILMGGVALASPWLPFTQVLLMAARPGWHTVYVVTVVLVAFIANMQLIPALGLVGAALATAIGLVVSMSLMRILARWRAGLRI